MFSRLYTGRVTHRRTGGPHHAFAYRLFMMYVDLDELPTLFDRYWLWSARRAAPGRFRRADYLGDPSRPLADCVRERIRAELGSAPQGPVRMLTHLRYFGHIFNPVTFYYCHDRPDGPVRVIVAEITNTPWKERHSYVLPVDAADAAGAGSPYRFEFDKAFHVSPFMPMAQRYRWRFSEPGDRLAVHMENMQDGQRVFDASLDLAARPLDGPGLARCLVTYPLMTVSVLARIYWQAARLLVKKARFYPHPA